MAAFKLNDGEQVIVYVGFRIFQRLFGAFIFLSVVSCFYGMAFGAFWFDINYLNGNILFQLLITLVILFITLLLCKMTTMKKEYMTENEARKFLNSRVGGKPDVN